MVLPSLHDAQVQAAWATDRPYLLAVATGMLNRRDDAEDVVQEAFARLTASPEAIRDVRGWLVVVTRRLCLDRLDRADNRRTIATAEPPEAPEGITDPADRMVIRDEVRQALSVVIGRLSPAERTSFILHDIFGFPFDAVAGLVGRTPAACRQLARRARLSVGTGSSDAELAEAWCADTRAAGLAELFIAVCEGGDVHGLIDLLDPEAAGFPIVIGVGPMPGVRGAVAVAERVMHLFGPSAGVSLQPFDLEGRAAAAVLRGEEVVAVIRLDGREGRITHLHTYARPSLVRWTAPGVTFLAAVPSLHDVNVSAPPDDLAVKPKEAGANMTTPDSQRSVLLMGASQNVLDDCVAAVRQLGYATQGTTDFSSDITAQFDVTQIDLISLGGLIPPARKAELKEQIGAINPRVIFIDALAGIPGLIAGQVQQAFTADGQDPASPPSYSPGDRSVRLTLAGPAAVKVTVWWRTSLIPPDPKSDSLVLLDDQLPGGDHKIPVPSRIPPQAATPNGLRSAPWFATVQAGPATYNFSIPAGQ